MMSLASTSSGLFARFTPSLTPPRSGQSGPVGLLTELSMFMTQPAALWRSLKSAGRLDVGRVTDMVLPLVLITPFVSDLPNDVLASVNELIHRSKTPSPPSINVALCRCQLIGF